MLPVASLLFDIDGTLIDSNDAHAHAWQDVFNENGHAVPYEKIRAAIGMGSDHLLPQLISVDADSKEGQALDKRRGEIFREKYLGTLRAFPQARELLETLKAKDYRIAIATSASARDLKMLLKQANLEGLFDAKANSADVEHSKPDPDIIQAALANAEFDRRRTVMVGDTPYDIEAAARAGLRTLAVTCGGWPANELAGAWKIFASPADLLHSLNVGQALI